jgi:hypothetical protein
MRGRCIMFRTTLSLLMALGLAGCPFVIPGLSGSEGEGEGPGPCTAEPSPAWDGTAIDYEQCQDPERFDPTACEGDVCVEGDFEAELVAMVRSIAAERGYGEHLSITDVTWEPNEGATFQVHWVIALDWLRCPGAAGADGADPQQFSVDDIEYMLPEAHEVPAAVPPLADVAAALETCASGAYFMPCRSGCRSLHTVFPGGEEGCDEFDLSLLDPEGLSCEGPPPYARCDIPEDWTCDRGSYYDPRCALR